MFQNISEAFKSLFQPQRPQHIECFQQQTQYLGTGIYDAKQGQQINYQNALYGFSNSAVGQPLYFSDTSQMANYLVTDGPNTINDVQYRVQQTVPQIEYSSGYSVTEQNKTELCDKVYGGNVGSVINYIVVLVPDGVLQTPPEHNGMTYAQYQQMAQNNNHAQQQAIYTQNTSNISQQQPVSYIQNTNGIYQQPTANIQNTNGIYQQPVANTQNVNSISQQQPVSSQQAYPAIQPAVIPPGYSQPQSILARLISTIIEAVINFFGIGINNNQPYQSPVAYESNNISSHNTAQCNK